MKPLHPNLFWAFFALTSPRANASIAIIGWYLPCCLRRKFRTSRQTGCLLACSAYHRRSLSFSALAVLGFKNHERPTRLEAWYKNKHGKILFLFSVLQAHPLAESLELGCWERLWITRPKSFGGVRCGFPPTEGVRCVCCGSMCCKTLGGAAVRSIWWCATFVLLLTGQATSCGN